MIVIKDKRSCQKTVLAHCYMSRAVNFKIIQGHFFNLLSSTAGRPLWYKDGTDYWDFYNDS